MERLGKKRGKETERKRARGMEGGSEGEEGEEHRLRIAHARYAARIKSCNPLRGGKKSRCGIGSEQSSLKTARLRINPVQSGASLLIDSVADKVV